MKVKIDAGLCQGHGRCSDLAPVCSVRTRRGYGQVLGDGVVPPEKEDDVRRVALNCP